MMKKLFMKIASLKAIFLTLTASVTGLVSMNAAATCSKLIATLPYYHPISFPSRLVVSNDLPVGSVIFTREEKIGPGTTQAFARCYSPGYIDSSLYPSRNADSNNVMPTNIAGVGYRLKMIIDGSTWRYMPWNYPRPTTSTTYSFSPDSKIVLEVVKTSRVVGAGRLDGVSYLMMAILNATISRSFPILEVPIRGSSGVGIVPQACTVTNQSINVPMGNVMRNHFSGVGSTAGDRAFNVSLNCRYQAGVSIRLDATADASRVRGVLALDSSSGGTTAGGVGIQILQNNAAVTFGQNKSVGSAPGTGSYDIPFVARYYQTGTSISPGEANGTATFTLTYN